jgi:hypothetical protein
METIIEVNDPDQFFIQGEDLVVIRSTSSRQAAAFKLQALECVQRSENVTLVITFHLNSGRSIRLVGFTDEREDLFNETFNGMFAF